MSKLEDLVNAIQTREDSYFDLHEDWNTFLDLLSELDFTGEVYNEEEAYLQTLVQVKRCDSVLANKYKDDVKELYTLTADDAKEFYTTKVLTPVKEFLTDTSVHMFLALKKKIVICYVGRNMDFNKTAKENYGILFQRNQPKYYDKQPPKAVVAKVNLNSCTDEKTVKVLEGVITALDYGRENHIKAFEQIISYPHSMIWGVDGKKVNVLTDEPMLETQRAEYVTLPVAHKSIASVAYDDEFLAVVGGACFETLNYADNGIVRTYNTEKAAKDVFYTIIDYINNKYDQGIEKLEKHYYSNKWPIAKTEAEAEANRAKYTKYEVSVSKVTGNIICVKLEIWNRGVVYDITNHNYFETPGVPTTKEEYAAKKAAAEEETEAPYDTASVQAANANS